MEESMKSLRVAYICHFSSPEIRSRLRLKSLWWGNLLRSVWRLPKLTYSDFGLWNADFISALEKVGDVECHVILPHLGLKRKRQRFEFNKVSYVLLQVKENLVKKVIRTLFSISNDGNHHDFAQQIKDEVDRIKPDIVVVCGAENPLYSSSVLLFHDKPIFVILQTWLNSPKRIEMGVGNEQRREIEDAIFKHASYFGTFDETVTDYIKKRNNTALFLRLMFPSSPPPINYRNNKQFDFTFFANGLTKNKGIEDVLIAFRYVRELHPEVTLNVIGDCDSDYMSHLRELMNNLGIISAITFHGSFPLKNDVLCEVAKARVAVLPSITAALNSTVRETMFMNIPTIVYDNAVVRFINRFEQNLLTASMEDTEDLGRKLIYAYEHLEEMSLMAGRARAYAENHFSVDAVGKTLVADIKSIVNHYYFQVEMEKDLLLAFDKD